MCVFMSEKKGKLLITGSSGFIGAATAREAVRQGYEVTGLDLVDSKDGIRSVKGSITDLGAVKKAVKGADYVIHLAAITSNVEFDKDLERCYTTNVEGFMNVIEAAKEARCKKFLYASSAAVYTGDTGFSEESIIDMKKQRNHYAKTKLINEMIADSYADTCKMQITGLRYFNVYGPGENQKGDYASVITRFIKMSRYKKPISIYGDGSQARDIVYIDDVAKISLELLRKGRKPVYNVGTGKATDYVSIANMVNPKNKKFVPNPLSSYQRFTQADTKLLLSAIGKFKFTPISEGVIRTTRSLR